MPSYNPRRILNFHRDGFLFGVIATGSQVLILREIISTLQGDEIFIGTVLFAWLFWGALGASLGGKTRNDTINIYFLILSILLPLIVISTRLSPLVFSTTVGAAIPFSYGTIISFIIVLPSSIICGALFAVLVRHAQINSDSIIHIYFSEGIGAFIAGILISLLTGIRLPTLSCAFILSIGLIFLVWFRKCKLRNSKLLFAAIELIITIILIIFSPRVNLFIDNLRYKPYKIISSYDTPYSHQTILERGGSLVLMTDNMVESAENDLQTAENLLLPPLAYKPDSKEILVFGQLDFTLSSFSGSLLKFQISEVDSRLPPIRGTNLSYKRAGSIKYIQNDPVTYLQQIPAGSFDIIVLPLDEIGSYRGTRLITEYVLNDISRVLKPGGVFNLVTSCNTAEYISPDDRPILSTLRASLAETFPSLQIWPGSSTLFIAGDSSITKLSPDTLAARLRNLQLNPQFINENYLFDRLSQWQLNRIYENTRFDAMPNSLERPILAGYQLRRHSSVYLADRWVSEFLDNKNLWGFGFLVILAFGVIYLILRQRKGRLGRVLYFTAGFTSISMELISFYIFQSTAGALYSRLTLLVGVFMLGLAFGTLTASRLISERLSKGILTLLVLTISVFLLTCLRIPPAAILIYHSLFQFIIAFCAGGLFVEATRRYYNEISGSGGIGYAIELTGSSLGALITMPILLPIIGLNWLLISMTLLVGLTIIAISFSRKIA